MTYLTESDREYLETATNDDLRKEIAAASDRDWASQCAHEIVRREKAKKARGEQ